MLKHDGSVFFGGRGRERNSMSGIRGEVRVGSLFIAMFDLGATREQSQGEDQRNSCEEENP
jgi:hypothetical protein